eukprot:CAMPEP_0173438824 /NCGR_PEP_ID=MMETSP1357-20121228/20619_1 /TAXON_ID=77926 /ORGANISM="Hemiselmis rufescens, Strain PCC563" /LENGTH=387 /DNA_ID=CAMNT_0014404145 /DNA_START=1 /DNA_END=1164 /DNA_ORIENTATION=-
MEFVEVVLGNKNPFVGDIVAESSFGQHYRCSMLALRHKGRVKPEAIASIPGWGAQSRQTSENLPVGQEPTSPTMRFFPKKSPFGPGPLDSSKKCGSKRRMSGAAAGSGAGGDHMKDKDDKARPSQDGEVDGKNLEVASSKLFAGDAILLLTPKGFAEKYAGKDDFLLVQTLGDTPRPVRLYDYFPLVVFLAMIIIIVTVEGMSMLQAAMSAAAFLVVGGWVDAKKATTYVPWDLMLLIGSMLGVSRSITESGLADTIGKGVKDAGMSPQATLFFLFAITQVMTEFTTNNAAAGLIFPIALSVAERLGVSWKPFLMCIMVAASASFITPIGYQTNMMVWAPGGYKFSDFSRIGVPLSTVFMVCVCLLIPTVWKFDEEVVHPTVTRRGG